MMEYISKQLAVEELENLRQQYEMSDDCDELVARKCKNAVSELPAADVVPVVRCRECLHYTDWGACGRPDNGWDAPKMGPEDFCSRGERKTDGN